MRVDLDELERLEKAATPGPWEADQCVVVDAEGNCLFQCHYEYKLENADTALAVYVRNAMPAIIAELRAARECVEYLERILDTDAVRNENEELDGEASAVLSEWKKATKGDG